MLHYVAHKHSKDVPWITFIHGAGGSSSIWYKQLRDFRRKFNVLLIDLRGHGKSKLALPKQIKRYAFDKLGNDVMEVIDHLNIKTTHFVGISLGTIIIRELADRFPERVESLIMGGAVMKLNVKGQILMRVGSIFKSVIPYLLLYKFFAIIIMPKKSHRESRNLFVREARKLYQKEFKRWFALVADINPLLALFRMQPAKMPTLYIMGEQDHMFLPSISKLIKNHSNSKLVVIPDCGHVVNVEQPAYFNKKAIQFIEAV